MRGHSTRRTCLTCPTHPTFVTLRGAEPQPDHVAAILEDAGERRRHEHAVRDAAERAERRGVEDAIFHHGPRAVGAKRVLVPPDAVRADFLDVDETPARFPD